MIVFNIKNLLSLVFIISISLLAFSCGEDDTPTIESTNDDLNGVWVATSYQQGGVELLPNTLSTLELTFTSTDTEGGTFSSVTTDLAGVQGAQTFSTYTVVDDGNRIVISTDTLDLTSSSSNLTLDGNIFFSTGEIRILAFKQ